MKVALKTVPPAPLPLGLWHPDPNAPPLDLGAPPVPTANIPAVNSPVGNAPANLAAPLSLSAPRTAQPVANPVQPAPNPADIHEQPVVTSIRRGGAAKPDLLLPPADVPGNVRSLPAPKPSKSLLQELFGN